MAGTSWQTVYSIPAIIGSVQLIRPPLVGFGWSPILSMGRLWVVPYTHYNNLISVITLFKWLLCILYLHEKRLIELN